MSGSLITRLKNTLGKPRPHVKPRPKGHIDADWWDTPKELPGKVKKDMKKALMGGGGGAAAAGGLLLTGDTSDNTDYLHKSPEQLEDEFFASFENEKPKTSGGAATEEKKLTAEEKALRLPGGPTMAKMKDIEPEIDKLVRAGEQEIASDSDARRKSIMTKQALARLLDAAGLLYAGQKGIVANVERTPIDTTLDEEELRDSRSAKRAMLRDKISQLRRNAYNEWKEKQSFNDKKYNDEWNRYKAEADAKYKSDKLEIDRMKAASKGDKDAARLARQKANQLQKVHNALMSKADKINRVLEKAQRDYEESGDEEGFIEMLERQGIPLDEEDKKLLIDERTLLPDNIKMPDRDWIDEKAKSMAGPIAGSAVVAGGGDSKDPAVQEYANQYFKGDYSRAYQFLKNRGDI